MIAQIEKLLRAQLKPLATRIANMVARGVVELVDDTTKMQLLQVSVGAEDETRGGIERVQNYGFTSVPLAGAEAVVLFHGGRRDHGLAIAVDDRRYRLRGLESGEVAIYTDEGDSVVIRRGGTVEVTAATKVVVDSPAVELAGAAQAAVLGTTYRTAEDTLLAALNTALSTAGGSLVTAGLDPTLVGLAPTAAGALNAAGVALNAFAAANTAFTAGASGYLSTKVKVG